MLNFIVAKNRHGTEGDANLLEGLIQEADVVSFENAFAAENDARGIESDFRLAYLMPDSQRRRSVQLLKNQTGGYDRLYCLIIEHKMPVILLERHTDAKDGKAWSETKKRIDTTTKPLELVLNGDYEGALKTVYQDALLVKEMARLRDSNMGQNGQSINDRIIEVYPHLADQEQINYLIIIGGLHRPEEGLASVPDSTFRVVPLNPKPKYPHWLSTIFSNVTSLDLGFEACRDDVARYLLAWAYRVAVIQHLKELSKRDNAELYKLSQVLVTNMGAENLQALTSRIQQSTNLLGEIGHFFADFGLPLPAKPQDFNKLFIKYRKAGNPQNMGPNYQRA